MQDMQTSTIAALATPGGSGGIGIIKISGPLAVSIAEAIFWPAKGSRRSKNFQSHQLYYGHIVEPESRTALDEVLISVMKAPFSYTREDVVEINTHGGAVAAQTILSLVMKTGAQLAEPGEFTRRAFLNGRIDLTQAEGVIDLIHARSRKALEFAAAQIEGELSQRIKAVRDFLLGLRVRLEAAIDFPEEVNDLVDPHQTAERIQRLAVQPLTRMIQSHSVGNLFRSGIKLTIVGKPNVGKSSLLNRLVHKQRAIVTDIPGTTRDVVEDVIQVKGLPIILMDTAGYHQTSHVVERIGVEKTKECIAQSDVVVFVVAADCPLSPDDRELYQMIRFKPHVVAANKSDIADSSAVKEIFESFASATQPLLISALHDRGIEELKQSIYSLIGGDHPIEVVDPVVPNVRQHALLEKSLGAVNSVVKTIENGTPYECVAIHLEEAVDALGDILGINVKDDILDRIFSQFCIGK